MDFKISLHPRYLLDRCERRLGRSEDSTRSLSLEVCSLDNNPSPDRLPEVMVNIDQIGRDRERSGVGDRYAIIMKGFA